VVYCWNGEEMKGTDEFIRKLNALKGAIPDIKEELEHTATDIEISAQRDAPISIAQKINKVASQGGLVQSIQVNAGKLGAYVEFGTGHSAAQLVPTLEQEWQDIARKFYINGQGRLVSKPYLYPNWIRYTNGLESRLKLILDKAIK
jgi:hypothetical protein